jgi:hypothetical protein
VVQVYLLLCEMTRANKGSKLVSKFDDKLQTLEANIFLTWDRGYKARLAYVTLLDDKLECLAIHILFLV